MPTKIIGTAPYQVPRNADLGTLAVQDADNANIQGGSVTLSSSSTQGYFQNTDISDVKPSLLLDFANGSNLDSRLYFSRASTAYTHDGTTAKAEENLCQYSEDFSSSVWTSTGSGIAAVLKNADIAPDGSITASVVSDTTSSWLGFRQTFYTPPDNVATPYTFSIFIKKMTSAPTALPALQIIGAVQSCVTLNPYTGVATAITSSGYTAPDSFNVTDIGNWYRLSITKTVNTASASALYAEFYPAVALASAAASVDATATGTVTVWGAQFEQRSGPSGYVKTTNASVSNTIPLLKSYSNDQPRFTRDPITKESKGILIEGSRTNYITYQNMSSMWSKSGLTSYANANVGPDGTLSAVRLVANTTTNYHYAYYNQYTPTTSTIYTASAYLKYAGWQFASVEIFMGGYDGSAMFDLVNGSIYSVSSNWSATITPVGNGWYRCTVTAPATTSTAPGGMVLHPVKDPNISVASQTGDGYSGIYAWGMQLEAGSYVSSYIPTTTTTASRANDRLISKGAALTSWLTQFEGTAYIEAEYPKSSDGWLFGLYDTTRLSTTSIAIVKRGSYMAVPEIYNSNTNDVILYHNINPSAFNKHAASWKADMVMGSVNGGTTQIDTSATIPPTDVVLWGSWYPSTGDTWVLYGHIKKFAFYPVALGAAELQEMTL